jgi:hypothetical protein
VQRFDKAEGGESRTEEGNKRTKEVYSSPSELQLGTQERINILDEEAD